MNKASTVEELFAALESPLRWVEIKGLGTLCLRALTYKERNEISKDSNIKVPGKELPEIDMDRYASLMFQTCIVEPKLTYDQAHKLINGPAIVIDQLMKQLNELTGLDDKGRVLKDAVDAAEESFR
jgi:hypothetical protein